MQTVSVPNEYHHIAPDGAEVRELMANQLGGIAHCILPQGTVSNITRHKTISEFWHILSGKGAIWRRNNHEEQITQLEPGVTIDIPSGTDFQYRSDEGNLVFICVTMPPWPGADEASYLEQGAWEPTVK